MEDTTSTPVVEMPSTPVADPAPTPAPAPAPADPFAGGTSVEDL